MNPQLIIGVVTTAMQVYEKVKEYKAQHDAGKEVTPEQVKALFDLYPAKNYDEYLNEARERAGVVKPPPAYDPDRDQAKLIF
jgi:hypothetical protein